MKFWELVVQEIDENIVLGCYQNSLDNAELSIDERNYFLDVFVTLSLMYESSDFLEEADRYSLELLNNLPHDLSAKGSRGCVLVETGDIAGGIELLTEVMQKEEEPVIRLICAAYLALAYSQINCPKVAIQWLNIAWDIDPQCFLLQRAETILHLSEKRCASTQAER